jgi:glycosyltransferase involved in cell wall biosynthesis
MPGHLDSRLVRKSWPDFDCVVHVPLSENCGGAPEPFLAGVPVIAASVGGLPEVVIDEVTGKIVPPRDPARLANAVLEVLEDLPKFRVLAKNGQRLIRAMFDVRRTSGEINAIYRHLLDPAVPRPGVFDSKAFLAEHA